MPPELLALDDPYDPAQNAPWRLHDASLYDGRYYLYFGPTPVVLVYLPLRLVGVDASEALAAATLGFAGFLFALALMRFLIDRYRPRTSLATQVVAALLLGLANVVPFLLRRPAVYEVAIAGGYACLMAGLHLTLTAVLRDRPSLWRLAAGSLALGLAVGARPNLIVALPIWIWAWRARLARARSRAGPGARDAGRGRARAPGGLPGRCSRSTTWCASGRRPSSAPAYQLAGVNLARRTTASRSTGSCPVPSRTLRHRRASTWSSRSRTSIRAHRSAARLLHGHHRAGRRDARHDPPGAPRLRGPGRPRRPWPPPGAPPRAHPARRRSCWRAPCWWPWSRSSRSTRPRCATRSIRPPSSCWRPSSVWLWLDENVRPPAPRIGPSGPRRAGVAIVGVLRPRLLGDRLLRRAARRSARRLPRRSSGPSPSCRRSPPIVAGTRSCCGSTAPASPVTTSQITVASASTGTSELTAIFTWNTAVPARGHRRRRGLLRRRGADHRGNRSPPGRAGHAASGHQHDHGALDAPPSPRTSRRAPASARWRSVPCARRPPG